MIKNLLTLCLISALGAGCATLSLPFLTADDPASPEASAAEQPPDRPALLAGSKTLAQWLATNRVDAANDAHSQHEFGNAPAQKPSPKPPGKEHQH